MTTTTGELLYKVAQLLRPMYYGRTWSTTVSTIVDQDRTESNDYFNGGTLFILTGGQANKTTTVSDWALATWTFSVYPSFALAPGTAVEYAVIDKKYPRSMMIGAINSALAELGPVPQTNQDLDTSITDPAYPLPTGVNNILRVEIAANDTAPYLFEDPYRHWVERDGMLYFDDNHLPTTASRTIRLTYNCMHDRVSADADAVDSAYDADLLATLAALHAARMKARHAGSSDPEPGILVQTLSGLYVGLRAQRPMRTMRKDSRLPGWIPPQDRW